MRDQTRQGMSTLCLNEEEVVMVSGDSSPESLFVFCNV